MLDENIKKKLVESIVESVNPHKIILFGSYAYGDPDFNSDLDILIIKDNFKSKIEEKRKIRKAIKDLDFSKDILVVSSFEFDFYKNQTGSLFQEVNEKGIVLWSS
jgi:uncharacterized protein